jgi:hypothetical protein
MAVEHILDLISEGYPEDEMDDNFKYFAMNLVLYNVVKLNYTMFLQRAKVPAYRGAKGVDAYGNVWDPLHPRTIAIKKKLGATYAGSIAINIRTRRLLNALRPGWFRNGVYIPREEQKISVSLTGFSFEVTVPYAVFVNSKRKIFVDDSQLIKDAIRKSLPVLRNYWNRRDVQRRVRRQQKVMDRYNAYVQEERRKKLRENNPPAPPDS